MNRFVLFHIVLLICVVSYSQEYDQRNISIAIEIPKKSGMPKDAVDMLSTKMTQMMVNSGMSDYGICKRFVLSSQINILEKDVTPTTPARVSQKVEVTFYISDVIDNLTFASTTIELLGIGTNENKAFKAAFQQIRANDSDLKRFTQEGKQKITAYYESNCKSIMANATRKASVQKYEEAITELVAIPCVCTNCYNEAQDLMVSIYRQMQCERCNSNLEKSKQYLSVGKYNDAVNTLMNIEAFCSSCYEESQRVLKQTHTKIIEQQSKKALSEIEAIWAKNKTADGVSSMIALSSSIIPDSPEYIKWEKIYSESLTKLKEDEARMLQQEKEDRERRLKIEEEERERQYMKEDREWDHKREQDKETHEDIRSIIGACVNIAKLFI